MTLQYTLDENDFLTHQLFIASKSKQISRKRKRSRIVIPVAYGAFAMLFYTQGRYELMAIFFLIAVLWFFIYPSWERKKYVKHYQNFIAENYKIRIGRMTSVALNNDQFITKDNGGESKILTTETDEIIEISTLILIRLKSGQSLIIPKLKIDNIEEVRSFLKSLADSLKINYCIKEDWKWN
jgi:hypothetical protein